MVTDRLYTIFDATEITNIDTSKITSNIRWSNDGSKFIVEWITTPLNDYMTHKEALVEMSKPEWNEEIDEI